MFFLSESLDGFRVFRKCGTSFLNVVAHLPGNCDSLADRNIDEESFGKCFESTFNKMMPATWRPPEVKMFSVSLGHKDRKGGIKNKGAKTQVLHSFATNRECLEWCLVLRLFACRALRVFEHINCVQARFKVGEFVISNQWVSMGVLWVSVKSSRKILSIPHSVGHVTPHLRHCVNRNMCTSQCRTCWEQRCMGTSPAWTMKLCGMKSTTSRRAASCPSSGNRSNAYCPSGMMRCALLWKSGSLDLNLLWPDLQMEPVPFNDASQ